jgi:group I intron endonuclease
MDNVIYAIESPSGNRYIGQSTNMAARWRTHQSLLRSKKHHSPALQNAYNKYGFLQHKVLCFVPAEHLDEAEQFLIDWLNPKYNATRNVVSACRDPAVAKKVQATHVLRKHITAEQSKTRWADQEYRNKAISGMLSAQQRPEVKEKKAQAAKNNILTRQQHPNWGIGGWPDFVGPSRPVGFTQRINRKASAEKKMLAGNANRATTKSWELQRTHGWLLLTIKGMQPLMLKYSRARAAGTKNNQDKAAYAVYMRMKRNTKD